MKNIFNAAALALCVPLIASAGITSVTTAESSSGGSVAPSGTAIIDGEASASAHSVVSEGEGSTTYRIEVRTEEGTQVHTERVEHTASDGTRVDVRVATTSGRAHASARIEADDTGVQPARPWEWLLGSASGSPSGISLAASSSRRVFFHLDKALSDFWDKFLSLFRF